VQSEFKEMNWIWDKRIQDGCSKRRPDLLLDLGSHVLIIEIDEHAHSDYNCSCESVRLQEISQDLSFRPLIIVRFNPDGYETLDGKKQASCWTTNKSGILGIGKKKQKEWNTSLSVLIEVLEYWMKNIPTETFELDKGQKIILEIVELFF
jgi:hypothetical protein